LAENCSGFVFAKMWQGTKFPEGGLLRRWRPNKGEITLKARSLTMVTAAAAAVVTLTVSVLPFVHFAYRRPALHLSLDTLAAFVALLTAFLIFGRFRQSGVLSDIVLVCALMLFGLTNLFFSALPAMVFDAPSEAFLTWAPISGRLLGTVAFMISPFLSMIRLRQPTRTAATLLLVSLTMLPFLGILVIVFASSLPSGIPPGLSPEASGRPRVVGHPVVLGLQLVAMVCFAAASIGFTRRAERSGDELMRWFGAGAAIAAFSRLNYFLFPSLYSDYVYTGDFLRLGFYLMLLWGAGREISAYWRGLAEVAVLEERRRLARDLHDGLGQELTFIWSQTRRFPEQGGRQRFELVGAAAERAIDESRRAIAALTMPIDEPLDSAISQTCSEIAGRLGVTVKTDLEGGVQVSPEIREGLLRIVREAVTNASRHGGAGSITVGLSRGDGLCLRVDDDGIGFDVSQARRNPRGFGLTSMEERARGLGGSFGISSEPGGGTQIEVRLP
jgi:signal transduction histidine kinase